MAAAKVVRALDEAGSRKHTDTDISVTWGNVTTSPGVHEVSLIAGGTGPTGRTGLNVVPDSITVKGTLQPGAGDNHNLFRIIIFRWDDDTSPIATDILTSGWGPSILHAPFNWDDAAKYKVLYDRKFVVDETDAPFVPFTAYKKFTPLDRIRFKSSTATDGISGRLFMMAMSDSAAIPHPIFEGYVRVTYHDA